MSEPLALSDEQLQTVTAAAALLWPRDRCGFLQSVANRLAAGGNLATAITLALGAYVVAGGRAAFTTGDQIHAASKQRQR